MRIERFVRGELSANGYIAIDEKTGIAYIIDPGYDGASYAEKLEKLQLRPEGILLTHHHYDHVGAVAEFKRIWKEKHGIKLPVAIHEEDAGKLKFKADRHLKDGDAIRFGESYLLALNTPGHTRGSMCFVNPDERVAFTGDTIFNVDLGRTDLEDGSEGQMIDSVKNIISLWEDGLIIYPGHGDSASMEYIRKYNQEYLEIMAIQAH